MNRKYTTHTPNLNSVRYGQDEFTTDCLECGQEIHEWNYLDTEDRKYIYNPWHTLELVKVSETVTRGVMNYDCPNA